MSATARASASAGSLVSKRFQIRVSSADGPPPVDYRATIPRLAAKLCEAFAFMALHGDPQQEFCDVLEFVRLDPLVELVAEVLRRSSNDMPLQEELFFSVNGRGMDTRAQRESLGQAREFTWSAREALYCDAFFETLNGAVCTWLHERSVKPPKDLVPLAIVRAIRRVLAPKHAQLLRDFEQKQTQMLRDFTKGSRR